jgi:hypothetical protein
LPGEGGWAGSMLGDEIGIVQGLGEIGENGGMDGAKRPSYFYPLFSKCYSSHYTTKSLT